MMNREGIILFLFLVLWPGFHIVGQNAAGRDSSAIYLPDREFWNSCLDDAKKIVTFPVRWNEDQWIGAIAVAGITTLSFFTDGSVQQSIPKEKPVIVESAFRWFIEPFGSGLYTIPALVAMYGAGVWRGDRKIQKVALRSVEAWVYTEVITQIVKQATHRHRPDQGEIPDPWRWEGPFGRIRYNSFPSGHTSGAFAVATVIGLSYSETIWVPVVCYSVATLVAAERIISNRHWMSDVIMGSAIGIAIGMTVAGNQVNQIRIVPGSPAGAGITLVYRIL